MPFPSPIRDANRLRPAFSRERQGGKKRQGGFSTVEILVGMTILIIVVTVVAGYYKYTLKAARRSDSFSVTTQLASSYLEKTKRDLTDPDTLKSILALIGTGEYNRTATETIQGKAYQVHMRYRKVSPAGKLIKVKATVVWDGGRTNALGTAFPYGE
jgi:type II secretory pathway pseudopilin PulG